MFRTHEKRNFTKCSIRLVLYLTNLFVFCCKLLLRIMQYVGERMFDKVAEVYALLKKNGLPISHYAYSQVIRAFGRLKKIQEMEDAFTEMCRMYTPTVANYNNMLDAY